MHACMQHTTKKRDKKYIYKYIYLHLVIRADFDAECGSHRRAVILSAGDVFDHRGRAVPGFLFVSQIRLIVRSSGAAKIQTSVCMICMYQLSCQFVCSFTSSVPIKFRRAHVPVFCQSVRSLVREQPKFKQGLFTRNLSSVRSLTSPVPIIFRQVTPVVVFVCSFVRSFGATKNQSSECTHVCSSSGVTTRDDS